MRSRFGKSTGAFHFCVLGRDQCTWNRDLPLNAKIAGVHEREKKKKNKMRGETER